MRRTAVFVALLLLAVTLMLASREPQTDSRLKNAFRRPEQNGWIFVHLEGAPVVIGYQHGYLLAPEILVVADQVALHALMLPERALDEQRNFAWKKRLGAKIGRAHV